jgi:hypothetical protein
VLLCGNKSVEFADKKGREGVFAMELLITLGRDSVVSYQNAASAKLKALRLGASIIRNTFALPVRKSAIRFSAARRSAF